LARRNEERRLAYHSRRTRRPAPVEVARIVAAGDHSEVRRINPSKVPMADPRALDEPLNDAELDELEVFLASDAVPQDCMDLEMLDGYLAAIVSGPELIQPSEWLPQVWSEGSKSAAPAFVDNDQAQRIMGLVLRHFVGIQRTLGESPTRFRPLLYMPDDNARKTERTPAEATAWCEGYMSGVKLRDDEWQPLYDAQDARDWIFPIEALAFGDRDDDFTEWVDSDEKRQELIDELPVAAVLIYRFWQGRREATQGRGTGARRSVLSDATRKSRQRLH
jgi:uncharacterized protein